MKAKLLYLFALAFLFSMNSFAQTWVPLGSTIPQTNNRGNTMCVDTITNTLIIGGDFSQVDGAAYGYMVRWDGNSFSTMPHFGPSGHVDDIAFYDSCVWVKGTFASAQSGNLFTPNNWARHSPSGWDLPIPFTSGGPGYFEAHDSLLYVMGNFNIPTQRLFGIDTNEVIQYSPLSGGFNFGGVITIHNYQGEKYIGGGFTQILGNPNANNLITIANGNAVPVSGYGANDPIYEMIEYNGELIVAGGYTVIGGDSIQYLAKFDGTNWTSLGTPPDAAVRDLEVYNGKLYVAGDFDTIGGIASRRIAVWNGQYWSRISSSPQNLQGSGVNDIEVFNNELYICGQFFGFGTGQIVTNFARMIDSAPIAEAWISDTTICVGDTIHFQDRSWGPADSIAWDFGGGSPSASTLLDEYVTFPASGTYTVTHYAYNQLGSDTTTYTIYVGGAAIDAGSDTISCPGSGVELSASGGTNYTWWPAAGLSDTTIANLLATPSIPTTYYVMAMDSIGCSSLDSVFVDTSSTVTANFIYDANLINLTNAVWFEDMSTGATSWEWHFGDGGTSTLQDPTHIFAYEDTFDVTLIACNADGCCDTFTIPDAVIAYDDTNVDELDEQYGFTIAPNPAKEHVLITFNNAVNTHRTVDIVDIAGRKVYSETVPNGSLNIQLECSTLNGGLYFVRIVVNDQVSKSTPLLICK